MAGSPAALRKVASAAAPDSPSPGERKVVTGNRLGGRLIVILLAAFASTARAQAPKPAQIDRNGVVILVRSTLLALDQANKTGNYTALRDIGSPGVYTKTHTTAGEPSAPP